MRNISDKKVRPTWAIGQGAGSNIDLIPQLEVPHAITSVLFLDSSEVLYAKSTDDPWFAATTPVDGNITSFDPNMRQFFTADEPVSVMACATQRKYCSPDNASMSACIDGFTGMDDRDYTTAALSKAWPEAQDRSAMRGFMSALGNQGAGFLDAYYTLPSAPTLLARGTILGNVQAATISSNHWQDEREQVYKASLAALQSTMVEHARRLYLNGELYCDASEGCERLCNVQVRKQVASKGPR